MKEAKGDMLYMECDALCITTNGFVKTNGECVMGAGIAKQISSAFPNIPYLLGQAILRKGNIVQPICVEHSIEILAFPVKPIYGIANGFNTVSHKNFHYGAQVPGWAMKADLDLITRSALQLKALADTKPWKTILLPRPGCGAGELLWEDVKPLISSILDDRFTACSY